MKQLAMGMESLMSELGVAGESGDDSARERQSAWEKLLVQDLENMTLDPSGKADVSGSKETKDNAGTSSAGEPAFQQSIQEMMDRLKQSESEIKVRVTPSTCYNSLLYLFPVYFHLVRGVRRCYR